MSECECDSYFQKQEKSRHLKTNKHLNFLEISNQNANQIIKKNVEYSCQLKPPPPASPECRY
jgi:hypothetical protein